ncbi:hypothetical protein Tco_1246032 [Tanacetum coccineum]
MDFITKAFRRNSTLAHVHLVCDCLMYSLPTCFLLLMKEMITKERLMRLLLEKKWSLRHLEVSVPMALSCLWGTLSGLVSFSLLTCGKALTCLVGEDKLDLCPLYADRALTAFNLHLVREEESVTVLYYNLTVFPPLYVMLVVFCSARRVADCQSQVPEIIVRVKSLSWAHSAVRLGVLWLPLHWELSVWHRGKLNTRYIRPFKILSKVGTIAYKLKLPQQLSRVHSMFHVSNLKKCLSDESLMILLDEIQIDDKLHFVKESVKIMDQEVKWLNQIRILIVKVRWNSRRGLEFTWDVKTNFETSIRTSSPTPLQKATRTEFQEEILLTLGDCDNLHFQVILRQ